MGADFLSAHVVTHPRIPLDWSRAAYAIAALDEADIHHALETCFTSDGEPSVDAAHNRTVVADIFAALQQLLDGDRTREVDFFTVCGYQVWVAGGMSWGDPPGDAFVILNDASWFPTVLSAIGLIPEGDTP